MRKSAGAWCLALIIAALNVSHARAGDVCGFACGDIDGDGDIDLADYGAFFACIDQPPSGSAECRCSDLDGSGLIDLRDFALFSLVFGNVSDEVPPNCSGALGTSANMTAYRPQNGGGYVPFARVAVAESDEASATLGPGIRINAPGDSDPNGEDDLIEVVLTLDSAGTAYSLRRDHDALRVWTTRDRQPGTEIPFTNDATAALPFGPTGTTLTVWVEWASPVHGVAELQIEPLGTGLAKDVLVFHSFRGIVIALGGEGQPPSNPVDPNHGTFLVAVVLYAMGYDVHMFDEDVVAADGTGLAYDTVADAIQNRQVEDVAIFGYSHGGGSTYDLADLLDVRRAMLGLFFIRYTSYVDSVGNNSDVDTSQELRRPPSTEYHLNHYQHGTLFEDFFLDGGPVPNSNPPPTGLDVETTPWGANCTHFEVDDFLEVRGLMETTLIPRVAR